MHINANLKSRVRNVAARYFHTQTHHFFAIKILNFIMITKLNELFDSICVAENKFISFKIVS